MNWERFGQDLLAWRTASQLSVRDAAKKVLITHATFSRAERGMIVSAENFCKILSYALDKHPRVYLDKTQRGKVRRGGVWHALDR